MKRLSMILAGLAALAVSSLPAKAVVVGNFGVNPTSAQGDFSNDPNGPVGGLFYDQYLFQLIGSSFVTVASATNTFATGIGSANYIANFTGAIYQIVGAVDAAPGGDDILRFGPQAASLCASSLCQTLSGVGLLPGGNYYLAIAGIAGATAGYGGNLSVTPLNAVPLPGAVWLFGSVIGGAGAAHQLLKRRRQRKLALTA